MTVALPGFDEILCNCII